MRYTQLFASVTALHASLLAGNPLTSHLGRTPNTIAMAESQGPLTRISALFRKLVVPDETITEMTRLLHPRGTMKTPKQSTGTSYLPAETVERAKAGTKFEKIKLEKDTTAIFTDMYDYAAKVRSGELNWEDLPSDDINTRLKWTGLLHRAKRNPGTFMMRLRVHNGIVNSDQMRFYADTVEPYGPDVGVIDITTRQNIQIGRAHV